MNKKSQHNPNCSDKVYAINPYFDAASLPIIDESLQKEMASAAYSGCDSEQYYPATGI